MREQDLEQQHKKIADFVRGLEDASKPETLYSVGVVSQRMAGEIHLSERTARRYLREAVAAGVLMEVKHIRRSLQFPWPVEELAKGAPERFVQGSVNRGWFYMTEERHVGPAMTKITFVFTPERLTQVMNRAREVGAEKAAEQKQREEARRQRWAEEEAAKAEIFAEAYPELTRLLRILHERVHVSGIAVASGVRLHAQKHPRVGMIGRVTLEVEDERFAELEAILRDGLGTAAEGGQEGSEE